MFKKQSNSVNIIKQILNISIEIRLRELFEISFKLSRQIFYDIIKKKNENSVQKAKSDRSNKDRKRKRNAH